MMHLPLEPTSPWAGCGWIITCMSTIPGLFVLGEANFSDHGANRLGASALMQGLADGYFVISYTLGNFLARAGKAKVADDSATAKAVAKDVEKGIAELLKIGEKGSRHPDDFHRKLGSSCTTSASMARNEAGLKEALEEIPALREEFWDDVQIHGSGQELNLLLEKAGRVADFLELAELMVIDALDRDESCGAHYREEHVGDDGEAKRNDEDYTYVAAWEHTGDLSKPKLHKEELDFEYVKLSQRSYKVSTGDDRGHRGAVGRRGRASPGSGWRDRPAGPTAGRPRRA